MGTPDITEAASVRTTCPYCGVGCGVVANVTALQVDVTGDAAHPANLGRLCSKGSALGLTLDPETRLLDPIVYGEKATWDVATRVVAERLLRIRDQHGADAIAFYLSGQLLTEDYYVANKLAKGFIGTPHVDTNSRLCMASAVAGHRRAFGADVVPGCYEDLDEADLIVLAGSNTAWCHPILYQRMQTARTRRRTKIVNIDPRRTATTEGCDIHLALSPGSDVILWNGLLVWLVDNKLTDGAYIAAHTKGMHDALAQARQTSPSIDLVSLATGLPRDEILKFYQLWSTTERTVTCYSQGINQSVSGTDKVNTIINCHLATNRIGKIGSGPFSLTGQPNAMGGREVGGLANMLAAHMNFSQAERERVGRFWNAPNLVQTEGMKAVTMFDAIAAGRIKALWVMGTNPAVSLPDAANISRTLAKLDLLVVSDVVRETDTLRHAHVKLPACGWGEKDGTVTNSERRISRQRAFTAPAGNSRPDWRIVCDVATAMGYGEAFAFPSVASVFREHASLSAFENEGERVFNLSGLAAMSDSEYAQLAPVQWPVRGNTGAKRVFGDGRFATADGAARFVAAAEAVISDRPTDPWPLVLNTGRIRDQWHTMTRTGIVPRLTAHLPEPFVEIHPSDAAVAGIADGMIARVKTVLGSSVLRARVAEEVLPGTIFVPMHWSLANSSAANIGSVIHKDCDPVSGQPDLKGTPVSIQLCTVRFYGYVLSRRRLNEIEHNSSIAYWSLAKIDEGYAYALALNADFADVKSYALSTVGLHPITLDDPAGGRFRAASLSDDRIEILASFAEAPAEVASSWMRAALTRRIASTAERRNLLLGEDASGTDSGSVVCVCHQIGARRIAEAIAAGHRDVATIGAACNAGTNCGSCIPELLRMCAAQDERSEMDTLGATEANTVCAANGQIDRSKLKCADRVTGEQVPAKGLLEIETTR